MVLTQRIIYEDNHLIAINKLCGEIVQGDRTGDTPLVELVKVHLKERDGKQGNVFAEVVHRIDRPVSGAILFAKTSKVVPRMNKLFHNGEVQKQYWAVVGKQPPNHADTLVHHVTKNQKQNKTYIHNHPREGSREARLSYQLIGSSDRYFYLQVQLHTGRHHQIRAQLAGIDCPIKGDLKYGFPRSNPDGGIHLHSRSISFVHPVSNQPLCIVAPPPNDVLWNNFIPLSKIF